MRARRSRSTRVRAFPGERKKESFWLASEWVNRREIDEIIAARSQFFSLYRDFFHSISRKVFLTRTARSFLRRARARALPETKREATRSFFHPAKSSVSNAIARFLYHLLSSPYPSHLVEMYTNTGLNPSALSSSFPTFAPRDVATPPFPLSSPLELALLLSLRPAQIPRGFFEGKFPSIRPGNDRGKTPIRASVGEKEFRVFRKCGFYIGSHGHIFYLTSIFSVSLSLFFSLSSQILFDILCARMGRKCNWLFFLTEREEDISRLKLKFRFNYVAFFITTCYYNSNNLLYI